MFSIFSIVFSGNIGEKNISIICVLQNFYTAGKYAREIRNSANTFCLFRNSCDNSINTRAARDLGLSSAYKSAEKEFSHTEFPYCYIDCSSKGSIANYRLFTDILSPIRTSFSVDGMKGYVVPEKFFLKYFKILSESGRSVRAVEKDENAKKNLQHSKIKKRSKKRRKNEEKSTPLLKL